MGAFVVRRLLTGVLLIALLTFLTFFVFNEIPTNPACLVVACGPHTTTTDADIKAADHRLGIDRPVIVQWADSSWRLLRHADFGVSWTDASGASVRALLGTALPATASLVAGGMLLMLLLAIPLGSLAAVRPRSALDRGMLALSVVGLAIHPFVLGITLRDFFGLHLHVPDFGYCPLLGSSATGFFAGSGSVSAVPVCGGVADWASHLAVPWLVFALLFLPLYMRMVRVRMIETLSEPYISTARAKGASEPRVVVGHALRNAAGPILPMLAVDAGAAITVAIYIETVFHINGLGSLAVRAFSGNQGGFDLPLIVGIVTVVGAFVILLNVGADIAGAWLDPRTRGQTGGGLIPLPAAINENPRARVALNSVLGMALVALVVVAVFAGRSGTAHGVSIGTPVRAVHVHWDDYLRVEIFGPVTSHGELHLRVNEVEFGKYGWRVHATIRNESPLSVLITPESPAAFPGSQIYPHQGMSLVVQVDNGGAIRELKVLPASSYLPKLPLHLPPHSAWTGTFSGSTPVAPKTLVYVGFGRFSADAAMVPQFLSTSSQKSLSAP